MLRHITLLILLSGFTETCAQTCDLVLLGYTPPVLSDGLHSFQVQWLNTENCGCNEFTQFDGNTCEESGSFHVSNNESVSHIVFGLHYVDEVTGEDYGENADCTSNTFHPGWSYVMTSNNAGWTNGFSTFVLNPPFSWDCIIENPLEGYCWEVVIWQINVSQTADYADFPFPEGWSSGTSFNETQTYPDINLSDNRLTFCPDPVVTDTVYVYETDTVFVELPADTVEVLTVDTVYVPWEWYFYDTVYVDVYDTIYINTLDTIVVTEVELEYVYVTDTLEIPVIDTLIVNEVDTFYQEIVIYEYITETDTIYEYVTELIDCETGLPCDNGFWEGDCRSVFVPNAFTPNNDGINDAFYALSESFTCWQEWRLQVYNRWGDLIWETDDPDEYWYGQVQNGNHFVSDGVYVWVLRAQGYDALTLDLQGYVTVFR